ncbi:G-type lectin S-receptor serine/threonine-protein kinase isoform X1 [Spatholobus suberectus]|nr:G-type lectin S-receptor serine/threonine-protein kinase isoform X1 [Spatholobus suberectus]
MVLTSSEIGLVVEKRVGSGEGDGKKKEEKNNRQNRKRRRKREEKKKKNLTIDSNLSKSNGLKFASHCERLVINNRDAKHGHRRKVVLAVTITVSCLVIIVLLAFSYMYKTKTKYKEKMALITFNQS